MRRENRQLAHYGIPFLFLLAVTIVVVILHGGLTAGKSSSATTSSTKVGTTTSVTSSHPATKVRIYKVQSGDTLGGIAIHFGVSVDDIVALNPGVEPTALRVGQPIKVTVGKTSTTP